MNSNTLNESHIRKSINSSNVSTPSGIKYINKLALNEYNLIYLDGSEMDEDDADSDSGQSSIDSWATTNMDSNSNPLLK